MPEIVDKLVTNTYPNNPLFGRRWKVSVLVPKVKNTISKKAEDYDAYVLSDSDYEDKSLRVTFDIVKQFGIAINFSMISVYNVRPNIRNLLIESGARVQVEAGYINGHFGMIYDGQVFQPMWEREDYVTEKITFKCVDGHDSLYGNWTKGCSAEMDDQKNIVLQMCKQATKPVDIVHFAEGLVNNRLSRPKVYFDKPIWYIKKFAQQSGTLPTIKAGEIAIDRPQQIDATRVALKLSPGVAGEEGGGGLIGWPQQTQDGISLTCLLNPNIDIFWPSMLVQIATKWIRQTEFVMGSTSPKPLDAQSVYKILGVNHIGDTRGQEWYTKMTGVNQAMAGYFVATPFGSSKDTVS
jgi:hypothetical protein